MHPRQSLAFCPNLNRQVSELGAGCCPLLIVALARHRELRDQSRSRETGGADGRSDEKERQAFCRMVQSIQEKNRPPYRWYEHDLYGA